MTSFFPFSNWSTKIRKNQVSVEKNQGYTIYTLIVHGGNPWGLLGLAPLSAVCSPNAWDRVNGNRYPSRGADDLSVGFVSKCNLHASSLMLGVPLSQLKLSLAKS